MTLARQDGLTATLARIPRPALSANPLAPALVALPMLPADIALQICCIAAGTTLLIARLTRQKIDSLTDRRHARPPPPSTSHAAS